MKIWSKARGAKVRLLLTNFARVCGRFCSETSHAAAVHGLCGKTKQRLCKAFLAAPKVYKLWLKQHVLKLKTLKKTAQHTLRGVCLSYV
jgi:hypothetical protein